MASDESLAWEDQDDVGYQELAQAA